MTRKEQNKILDDKMESNVNQYKIDRLNAEISAFSSGDLSKYEFLTRENLKYKPNALDKVTFEFSPLGKAFSTRLDKTVQGYQEEGVIKLLKDIRDNLTGGNRPTGNVDDRQNIPDDRPDRSDRPVDNDDNDDIIKNLKDKILDLETKLKDSELSNEEKDKLNNEEKDEIYKMLDKFKDNMKEI